MRDRRGPFTALVLAIAYALLVLSTVAWLVGLLGYGTDFELTPALKTLLLLNFLSLLWRCTARFAFTAREYGWREGAWAVLRIPVANIVAIMAGRRAILAYARSLSGGAVEWDKTEHHAHPAMPQLVRVAQ